jgi:hypothetical protein
MLSGWLVAERPFELASGICCTGFDCVVPKARRGPLVRSALEPEALPGPGPGNVLGERGPETGPPVDLSIEPDVTPDIGFAVGADLPADLPVCPTAGPPIITDCAVPTALDKPAEP